MMKTHNAIVRNILQVTVYLQREANRLLLDRCGLTQQQFVVLHEIVRLKTVNQKELAAELLLEKSNVSKIVKKLRGQSLVHSVREGDDRRKMHLAASDGGIRVWGRGMRLLDAWNDKWMSGLSEKHQGEILESSKILRKMVEEIN